MKLKLKRSAWMVAFAAATVAPVVTFGVEPGAPPVQRQQSAGTEEAAVKSNRIDNGKLSITYNADAAEGKRLEIRGGGAWGQVESVALCPEIAKDVSGFRVVEQKDALGTTQAIEVQSKNGTQRVWLHKNEPLIFTRITLTNATNEAATFKTVVPLSFTVRPEVGAEQLRYFASDGLDKAAGKKESYAFLALVEPKTRAGWVAGFVTHDRASGILASTPGGSEFRFDARSEYGKLTLPARQTAQGEVFAFGHFEDARLGLEHLADVTATFYDIKLPNPACGYSTWYHAKALDQDRMKQMAEFADANHLKDFGLGFLQIDDQWQIHRRDFTTHKTGEKANYPDGMKATAENITQHGFTAGLWLTPFGWQGRDFQDDKPSPNETALKEHPDWFVKKQDGSIYWVRWAGDCLDMSHPEAQQFLAGVIGKMTHDWGYGLLKIDGLWAGMACSILYPSPKYRDDGLGDAVFHDPLKTNVDVYRDGLRLVRQASGGQEKTFILGCNIAQNMRTLGGSIGLVDSMRIGPDIGASWDKIVRCAKPAGWLYFLNGRVWWNDPDCLMLRDPLTVDNGRAWGTFIAVSGQLHLVSEWLPGLPPEKLEIYKRTVPNAVHTASRPVDLFEHEMPQKWHLTYGAGDDRRDVVALFNWNTPPEALQKPTTGTAQEEPTGPAAKSSRVPTEPVTLSVDLKELGMPDGRYVGFDFWDNQFVGAFDSTKAFTLKPGSCKALVFAKELDRPQLLSTSRHVTQGMADVIECKWDGASGTLRGKSRIVAGDPYELRIRPAGMKASGVKADVEGKVTAAEGDVARVTLTSPDTREVAWEVRFAK